MHKNYQLLSGDIICGEYRDGSLTISNHRLAPLFLDDFETWVSTRAISASRGLTSRNIKSASGLSAVSSDFETALRNHAVCITDNYWVRESGSSLTWEDVNFDRYDGFFRDLALGLDYSWSDYVSDKSNPELTNIGNSDKAWHIDKDGRRWLYKRQPLNECFYEVLASKLAAKLGIDTVEYEICYASDPDPNIGRFGIIRSKDFTQGREVNLESAYMILRHYGCKSTDIECNARIFDSFGLVRNYLNIKYLDILTGNPDRHEFNYGILRDRATGDVVGMAPNFDNNFAFFAYNMPADDFVKEAKRYGWSRPSPEDRILEDITEEMRGVPGFDENIQVLQSVLRRNSFRI